MLVGMGGVQLADLMGAAGGTLGPGALRWRGEALRWRGEVIRWRN